MSLMFFFSLVVDSKATANYDPNAELCRRSLRRTSGRNVPLETNFACICPRCRVSSVPESSGLRGMRKTSNEHGSCNF